MPHILLFGSPCSVRPVPHAKLLTLERDPRIGDRVRIDLIEFDNRETRMPGERRFLPVADGEPQGVLPGDRQSEPPAHVVEVSLLADWNDAADRRSAIVEHS